MDLSETSNLPAAAPVLAFSPHPLMPAHERQLAEFLPGETIGAFLERTGILARLGRQPFVLTINGLKVPRSVWWRCRPKHGTLINLYAVARGDGKNPLGVIAMIGLMVFVPGAQGLAGMIAGAGASAFAINAIGAGLMIVGGLASNAVFPPPRPPNPGRPASESPTYSLAGGSNRMRPYEPLPKLCGKTRFFPDLGARPYTEFMGEDQVLMQVFDCGYNDIVSSDFRIGPTPLASFGGVELEESGPDGKLTLFPGNVDTQAGGALSGPPGWIQRTSSPNATSLAVELTGSLFNVAEEGHLTEHSVVMEFQYRAVGAADWTALQFAADTVPAIGAPGIGVARMPAREFNASSAEGLPAGQFRIFNGKRAPLRRTLLWNVAEGQYEVRVQRLTDDTGSTMRFSEIAWSQLRTYQPDTADYTGRKRFALRIRASGQLSGVVDQFNFIASARCETWNGAAWVIAETSNPGFWELDLLRGKSVVNRRVWGGLLPDTRIDIENLKAFAAWCTAKNLTFDHVFDQQVTLQDMLSMVALCGRGTLSRGSGKHGVVWDAPDQAEVAVFSMANIKRDSFSIEYLSEDLADEIVLSFVNPELDHQTDVVRALAPGVTNPVRSRAAHLAGCQNKDMAGRHVNLMIAQNVHRTRRYRWRTDWEGMPAGRGDVVRFSHDLASYDYSGRLVEGSSAATLKLSRAVPLEAGGGFVTIVKPDQTFATYEIEGGVGETDTLTPSEPLPFDPGADANHPPYDYRFLFGVSPTPGKLVKLDAWMPKGPDVIEITAIDETPEFYASEADPYLYVPPRPVFGTPEISNLQVTEEGVRVAGGYLVEATLTWEAGGDYGFAEIRSAVNGATLGEPVTTRGRSHSLRVADGSVLYVEVTAYSSLHRLGKSVKATVEKAIDFAGLFPPSDVADFALDGDTFRWVEVPDVDLKGYKIRFHLGNNRSFPDANALHTGLLPYSPKEFPVLPSGLVTFFLTAVDAADRESVNPAIIVKDLGDADLENVVEEIDFRALGWPGTITGGAVVGGDLEAVGSTDFYGPGDTAFYGAPAEAFYEDEVYTTLVYETEMLYFPTQWIGAPMTLVHQIEGEGIQIEYRRTNTQDFYGADGEDFYGADAESFFGADGEWQPWPGAVSFEGGDYLFRITVSGGSVQGAIRALELVIDVEDIREEFPNMDIPPGGVRLVLTKPIRVIKTIKGTLEDDGGTAVDFKWIDKEVNPGPLVIARDAAQVSVAGRADVTVTGHA